MQEYIEELREDIFEASISPALWQNIIQKIQRLCPDAYVSVMFYDKLASQIPWDYMTLEGEDLKQYQERYRAINSLWPVMQDQKEGTVSDTDYFDAINQIKHTEFYNDFMRPAKCDFMIGAVVDTVPGSVAACVVSFLGNIDRKHTEPSREILQALLPAMEQSFKLSRRYAGQLVSQVNHQGRVDALSSPAFILKENGVIDVMNGAAYRVLQQKRGVVSGFGDRLLLSDGKSNDRLLQLLKAEFSGVRGKKDADGIERAAAGRFHFPVRGEKDGARVTLVPIWGRHYQDRSLLRVLAGDNGKRVIVILQYEKDLADRLAPLLKTMFKLTKTETEVALAIMQGMSVIGYAEQIGRAEATVRQHLGKVYNKTGTHHQGELVALLHGYKDIFRLDRGDGIEE